MSIKQSKMQAGAISAGCIISISQEPSPQGAWCRPDKPSGNAPPEEATHASGADFRFSCARRRLPLHELHLRRLNHIHMAEQRPSPQAGPFQRAEQGAISASRSNLRRLSHVHRAEQRAISAARSYLRRLASRHAIGRCMVPSGQAIGRCLPRKQLTRPELSSGSHGQGGGCLSPRAGLSNLRKQG